MWLNFTILIRSLGAGDQIWLPMIIDPAHLAPGSFGYSCVGRLKSGEAIATARADFRRVTAHIGDVVPALTPAFIANARFASEMFPLTDSLVGDVQRPLWIVLGTSAFVMPGSAA